MNNIRKSVLGLCLFLVAALSGVAWGQAAGVSPSDCVSVRYITALWLSSSGKKVAYLLKAPNIQQNRNDYQLFVRSLGTSASAERKLVLTGAAISDVHWLNDDRRIAVLMGNAAGNKTRLVIVDTSTNKLQQLSGTQSSIESYSIDSTGSTIAYTVPETENADKKVLGMSSDDIARGYRIAPGPDMTAGVVARSIYILRRKGDGEWSSPSLVTIENPFTHVKTTHLPFARSLSLSPNGKQLLFNYYSDSIPDKWKQDPALKSFLNSEQFDIMVLYDIGKGTTSLAINSLYPASTPLWSADNRSFLVNSPSPIGSRWQAEDVRAHRASGADANLFKVDVESGQVEEVFIHVPFHHEGPLAWRPDGDVILRSGFARIIRLHRAGDSWEQIDQIDLGQSDQDLFSLLASNGSEIIGTRETITTPPELVEYAMDQRQLHILTNLNPELARDRLASVETEHWITGGGLAVTGYLFLPPHYDPAKRYPLVIQTKGDSGWFACDSGENHDPSFAPQPIATAGMMYLVRGQSVDWKFQDDLDNRPKDYPGGIGEAVQQMDIWDSAVDMLEKKGRIDSSKVGIVGFSRTGWEVEFDLAHAHTRYAAATVADNVQYSLSDYWLYPWLDGDYERMYGGPPYGATLENWEKYSISFNLERIHTPMLLEMMGYGAHEDLPFKWPGTIPRNLINRYEITKGLSRLGKPFEMYYYPEEQHQLDHPKARVASLQRNLDWYRFWLQGYERPNAEDPDQYKRWEHLKGLQDDEDKAASQPTVAKPN
jgi:dipeptidyl aminopeptidase/acylaminoacyl peptidase